MSDTILFLIGLGVLFVGYAIAGKILSDAFLELDTYFKPKVESIRNDLKRASRIASIVLLLPGIASWFTTDAVFLMVINVGTIPLYMIYEQIRFQKLSERLRNSEVPVSYVISVRNAHVVVLAAWLLCYIPRIVLLF